MTKKTYALNVPSLVVSYTAQSLSFALKTADLVGGTSITASNLGFALEEGFFVQFIKLFESSTISDSEVIAFLKTITDSSVVADAVATAFNKARADSAATADEIVFATFKAVANTATVTDALASALGTSRSDASETSDVRVNHFNKKPNDTVTATDDLDGVASLDDDQELQFIKDRTDAANFTDELYRRVDYTRPFAHTGSVSDNDTLAFSSLRADAYNVSEASTRAVGKVHADTSNITDSNTLHTVKPHTDNSNFTDSETKGTGTVRADAGSVTDNDTLALAKTLFAGANASFTPYKLRIIGGNGYIYFVSLADRGYFLGDVGNANHGGNTIRINNHPSGDLGTAEVTAWGYDDGYHTLILSSAYFPSELSASATAAAGLTVTSVSGRTRLDVTLRDAYTHALTKAFFETPSLTSVLYRQVDYVRAFTDTATVTDDLDGAASILDDQELQFVKDRTNTFSAAESKSLGSGKPFFETTSATDAGSIRSQGFSDFSFFAEDFVGASRTFT